MQHSSVSEDRLEQLLASLNKAREHSEQYARCRLELREVENEPPISSVARNTVDTIGKGPSEAQAQRVPGGTVRVCLMRCHYCSVICVLVQFHLWQSAGLQYSKASSG